MLIGRSNCLSFRRRKVSLSPILLVCKSTCARRNRRKHPNASPAQQQCGLQTFVSPSHAHALAARRSRISSGARDRDPNLRVCPPDTLPEEREGASRLAAKPVCPTSSGEGRDERSIREGGDSFCLRLLLLLCASSPFGASWKGLQLPGRSGCRRLLDVCLHVWERFRRASRGLRVTYGMERASKRGGKGVFVDELSSV